MRYRYFCRLKDTQIKVLEDIDNIKHCFCIISPKRTITLQAHSKEHLDTWVDLINKQIIERKKVAYSRQSVKVIFYKTNFGKKIY